MPTSRPTTEAINGVYRRLLAGEADAPYDLVEVLLEPLVAALRRKFPSLPDPNLTIDAATDSLFRLIQNPQRFDPERGTLWNYLVMDAVGDLRNAWQKEQRRWRREQPLDRVAFDLPDGKSDVEGTILRKLAPEGIPDNGNVAEVLARLRAEIAPQDWQVLLLMGQGERRTAIYAQVLGITDLPLTEQRRRVKRVKDRLRLMLKRRGAIFNEE